MVGGAHPRQLATDRGVKRTGALSVSRTAVASGRWGSWWKSADFIREVRFRFSSRHSIVLCVRNPGSTVKVSNFGRNGN